MRCLRTNGNSETLSDSVGTAHQCQPWRSGSIPTQIPQPPALLSAVFPSLSSSPQCLGANTRTGASSGWQDHHIACSPLVLCGLWRVHMQ